ncbi:MULTISPECIES: hypothetical protein [Bacillus cereus group]|uniref:hypothetical protein n=1 Tax=Bacillus cereus group TaxID=86661 RepID=UPI0022E22A9A|nr:MULTISPECIES: hypothetical protein [unclassified Bacillus cereus group]MDA2665555.1 hypothetical protein [Bacillus cereus group sp. Bc032]MDA2676341.1 hypothetical protein [Bacillus cereus group sp. Bc031]MDA2681813.1 hypothetical protein [Bacillus cereus group sp. Bc029]MDA2687269.1 hypothetical protein [Bacillus cereus group sp. Bc030]MDA2742757.1 hypothetical protein [Bacillus cereus group sp. Bc011]
MEKFSFFNSINGDRRYKAEDWANYFNKFITNGYFPNIASNLQVIASGTNMKVTLRAGAAWINGYMYQNTMDFDLTIQTADAVNSRKDRVVLRLDHEKREIKAYVKKGTPSSSPVAPVLQRDADAYELAVAEVLVRNGVVVITQEAVTDVRLNKDLCGVVNSLLQADTTMIFNQYWDWFVRTKQKYDEDNTTIMSDFRKFMEDEKKRYNTEFTTWFQNLKNILDTNTAGNLLNEINKINDKWNATLVELDKKSQAVQHGLNVINAPISSPLNIEIQGRTLANVLGKDGAVPQTNKVFSVETAKYYLIINSSGAQVTVDNTAQNTPYKFTGKASVSLTWTVGMVALYEVDQATYNKINIDPEFSSQKLISKFPYMEGVQHLNPALNIAGTNPSYVYTNILIAGQNGVNDVLYQEDGQWKVLRKWLIDKSTKTITLLPQSFVETVQVEGDLAVSGTTQVTVGSGVVVREKVSIAETSSNFWINVETLPVSKLKNKALKILKIYKNGVDNTSDWLIRPTGSNVAFGNEYASMSKTDRPTFDSTAEYTVTYSILDKHLYTTNVIDTKVMYNQSLASTVREVVEKQTDNSTLLFVVQAKVSELTTKTKEYGLRLTPRRSNKDENDIFTVTEYKMANGTVRKRSVLSNPNAYGSYLTRTETEYLENGAVQKVTLLDLIYDADGNFIDEVERT